MDKTGNEARKSRWDWLPSQMPGVARLLAEKRAELGDAWVNMCWQRGVTERKAGWFFASEGALHVGTLMDDPNIIAAACARFTETQVFLQLAEKGRADGA
jgi:hypothetical protein